jgi:hypothetical protein
MQCTTNAPVCQEEMALSVVPSWLADQWPAVLEPLSSHLDIESTARETCALVRRREVRRAADLLRLVLAYAVCDWSLRLVGAWATLMGIAALSDVAVRKRLQNCQQWLGQMLVALLQARQLQLRAQPGVRLRLMDGTRVSRPGSKGTDWVLHLSLDLGHLCLDGVEVTDAHSGETLARYPVQPGEIRVADRGYAYASSLGPVLADDGQLVVRINWQNLPLEWEDGSRVEIVRLLRDWPPQQVVVEHALWLRTAQGRFAMRLVLAALPQEAADRARQQVYKRCSKKGRTPDQRTLLAAGFTLLLTNLPVETWPVQEVLALYRVRWQVELHIKRLKSVGHLDHLRAKDPHLAQVYLLGKLLAALFIDQFTQQARCRCPAWFQSRERPLSVWRLTVLGLDAFRALVRGPLTLDQILHDLPSLERYLCDRPRRRKQQLAMSRLWVEQLLSV